MTRQQGRQKSDDRKDARASKPLPPLAPFDLIPLPDAMDRLGNALFAEDWPRDWTKAWDSLREYSYEPQRELRVRGGRLAGKGQRDRWSRWVEIPEGQQPDLGALKEDEEQVVRRMPGVADDEGDEHWEVTRRRVWRDRDPDVRAVDAESGADLDVQVLDDSRGVRVFRDGRHILDYRRGGAALHRAVVMGQQAGAAGMWKRVDVVGPDEDPESDIEAFRTLRCFERTRERLTYALRHGEARAVVVDPVPLTHKGTWLQAAGIEGALPSRRFVRRDWHEVHADAWFELSIDALRSMCWDSEALFDDGNMRELFIVEEDLEQFADQAAEEVAALAYMHRSAMDSVYPDEPRRRGRPRKPLGNLFRSYKLETLERKRGDGLGLMRWVSDHEGFWLVEEKGPPKKADLFHEDGWSWNKKQATAVLRQCIEAKKKRDS